MQLWSSPTRISIVLLLVAVSFAGCGHFSSGKPVNEVNARDACKTFLEAWKEGKTPADLKPKITGADHEWASGEKLVSYEILPKETSNGTTLYVSARLTLKSAKGVETKSNATYAVGTSPVITVLREEI